MGRADGAAVSVGAQAGDRTAHQQHQPGRCNGVSNTSHLATQALATLGHRRGQPQGVRAVTALDRSKNSRA